MTTDFRYVTLEDDPSAAVSTITLNRPEKLNAMNQAAQLELLEVLDRCSGRSRVVILTGAGDRSFCTGIDLSELKQLQGGSESDQRDTWTQACLGIRSHPAVFISAVNGFALGGGLTLVNVSDLAVAAAGATFGMPEVAFGSFPRLAGPSTVARGIAPKNVSWMALTTERVDAATALSWGLINKVVAPEDLMGYVENLARKIAGFDDTVLTWTKRGLAAVENLELEKALEFGRYVRAMIMKEQS